MGYDERISAVDVEAEAVPAVVAGSEIHLHAQGMPILVVFGD